jgi:hypothetical protein
VSKLALSSPTLILQRWLKKKPKNKNINLRKHLLSSDKLALSSPTLILSVSYKRARALAFFLTQNL